MRRSGRGWGPGSPMGTMEQRLRQSPSTAVEGVDHHGRWKRNTQVFAETSCLPQTKASVTLRLGFKNVCNIPLRNSG